MLFCLLLYNSEQAINFPTKEICSIVSLQLSSLFYKFYYSNVYFACTVVWQTFIYTHTFGVGILWILFCVGCRKMKMHAGLHSTMVNNIYMYRVCQKCRILHPRIRGVHTKKNLRYFFPFRTIISRNLHSKLFSTGIFFL